MIKLLLPLFLSLSFAQKTVNNLHPSDIDCFGVIGDSISAGFSLESHSIFKELYEYRGRAFDIGGEDGYRTLPNIFSQYGSIKRCASYGKTFITHSLFQYQNFDFDKSIDIYDIYDIEAEEDKKDINCNVAISGAVSNQMMTMWNNLIAEWNTQYCMDDWKVLTIMIGANDICAYCLNGYNNTVQSYIFNMAQLFQNIIRMSRNLFVNVISTFDVGLTTDWQNESCKLVHELIDECPCILGKHKQSDARPMVRGLYKDINSQLYPLVDKYSKLGEGKQIKFVVQPIIEDFQIYNSSYLSSLDCFHPSEFGHKCLATILWNDMFLPPEKKIKNLPYMVPLFVPGPEDFLQ